MMALGLVAFAFASLFLVYSTGMGLIRAQQQTIHSTLLLEERCAALRNANWSVLTDAARLKETLYQTPSPAEAHLPQLVEEIDLRPYSIGATLTTPLTIRHSPGTQPTTVSPAPAALATASCVRVDVRLSWRNAQRSAARETSLVLALGGTGK